MPVQVLPLMLPTVAPSEAAALRANSRHLLHDVAWYGVLAASSMAFLSVFATRLGATPYQIALLTAGPAVVNLIGSIPFGHWLEGRQLVRTSYHAAVWTRAGYLALIVLPALFAPAGQIWSLIALTLGHVGPRHTLGDQL